MRETGRDRGRLAGIETDGDWKRTEGDWQDLGRVAGLRETDRDWQRPDRD